MSAHRIDRVSALGRAAAAASATALVTATVLPQHTRAGFASMRVRLVTP